MKQYENNLAISNKKIPNMYKKFCTEAKFLLDYNTRKQYFLFGTFDV